MIVSKRMPIVKLDVIKSLLKQIKVYTEGDDKIYSGDVITIDLTMIRENLEENEKANPIYAPK